MSLTHQLQAVEADTGISGFTGPSGALLRFDTSKAEARAAIMATMDRLAAGARFGNRPIPVSETTRAALVAKHPGYSAAHIDVLAQIAATFDGGRVW